MKKIMFIPLLALVLFSCSNYAYCASRKIANHKKPETNYYQHLKEYKENYLEQYNFLERFNKENDLHLKKVPETWHKFASKKNIQQIKNDINHLHSFKEKIKNNYNELKHDLKDVAAADFINDNIDGLFSVEIDDDDIINSKLPSLQTRETFTLDNFSKLDNLSNDQIENNKFISIAPSRSSDYRLRIINKMYETKLVDKGENTTEEETLIPFNVYITCKGGSINVEIPVFFDQNNTYSSKFVLYNKVDILFSKNVSSCEIFFKRVWDKRYKRKITLINEKSLYPDVYKFGDYIADFCFTNGDSKLDTPYDFFLNASFLNTSCIKKNSSKPIKFLSSSKSSLNTKINILSGLNIDNDEIENKNFKYQLEFDERKFDLIIISYLVFKSDFSGNIIAQALKHHADKGTMIRILVSDLPMDLTMTKKDRLLMSELTNYSGHIKIKYYNYKQKNNFFDRIHRVMHSKLFLTFSKDSPHLNNLITGGRNLKDTFFFKRTPIFKKFKKFIQYGVEDEFVHMTDLEVLIKSKALIKQVMHQFFSTWHNDYTNMHTRNTHANLPILPKFSSTETNDLYEMLSKNVYFRHIYSIPYVDENEISNVFVKMIDSAHKSIEIVTPYFGPIPKILDALDRAIKRNVKISIVTVFNLDGDVPRIVQEMNKNTANHFIEHANIYEWDNNSIIHAKNMMIDKQILFIGGVNTNHRSFLHDVESGVIITGEKVINKYSKLFDERYTNPKFSKKLEGKLKISTMYKLIISLFGNFL